MTIQNGGTGVTREEFHSRGRLSRLVPLERCNPNPLTQGLDAYVFEVPPRYRGYSGAMIEWSGRTESPLGYDLFPYLYNETCSSWAEFLGHPLDVQEGLACPIQASD